MNIRLHNEANNDIVRIYIRLDRRAIGRGAKFRAYFNKRVALLSSFPQSCAKVRRGVPGREVRLLILKKYKHLVHYEVTATEIVVLSVTDARRRGHPWRQRL
jgi:hypothetical protein